MEAEDEAARPWTGGSGAGRIDVEGKEWFACDPYPTWYRWENGRLIVPNYKLIWEDDEITVNVGTRHWNALLEGKIIASADTLFELAESLDGMEPDAVMRSGSSDLPGMP